MVRYTMINYLNIEADTSANTPPSITIIEPDGIDDTADTSFRISWSAADPDDNAKIALYYDTDNTGMDGTLLIQGISEDGPDSAYIWHTQQVPAGRYYIYGTIDDGKSPSAADYSAYPLTVAHGPVAPGGLSLTPIFLLLLGD